MPSTSTRGAAARAGAKACGIHLVDTRQPLIMVLMTVSPDRCPRAPPCTVHHGEDQQVPHAQMVQRVHVLAVAQQRQHPRREQGVGPAVHAQAFTVKRKAGADHEHRAQHVHEEHAGLGQRVVALPGFGVGLEEQVMLDLADHAAPPLGVEQLDGHHKDLARELVAQEGPDHPHHEHHGKEVGRCEVRKADVAEAEMVAGFTTG
jgi:hypothetical protein